MAEMKLVRGMLGTWDLLNCLISLLKKARDLTASWISDALSVKDRFKTKVREQGADLVICAPEDPGLNPETERKK